MLAMTRAKKSKQNAKKSPLPIIAKYVANPSSKMKTRSKIVNISINYYVKFSPNKIIEKFVKLSLI